MQTAHGPLRFNPSHPAPEERWDPRPEKPKLSPEAVGVLFRLGEVVEVALTSTMRERVDRAAREIIARPRQHYGRTPEKIRQDCQSLYLDEAASAALGLPRNPYLERAGTVYEGETVAYERMAFDVWHEQTGTRFELKSLHAGADNLYVHDFERKWAHLRHQDVRPDYLLVARLALSEQAVRFKFLFAVPMQAVYNYDVSRTTRFFAPTGKMRHRVCHEEIVSEGFGVMARRDQWRAI